MLQGLNPIRKDRAEEAVMKRLGLLVLALALSAATVSPLRAACLNIVFRTSDGGWDTTYCCDRGCCAANYELCVNGCIPPGGGPPAPSCWSSCGHSLTTCTLYVEPY